MAKPKKSKKIQGTNPHTSDRASSNVMPDPVQPNRGLGSAYAQAVNNMMDAAADISGSKAAFLGVPKKVVDHLENLHSSILPKGFDASKRL